MSKSAKTIPLAKEPQGKDAGSLLSAWSPLRESVFRALWIATVVSNIGTWMQDVGESWLMTSLTPSPAAGNADLDGRRCGRDGCPGVNGPNDYSNRASDGR